MYSFTLALALSVIVACNAQHHGHGESYASVNLHSGHGHEVVYHDHPKYQFKYGIADGHTKDQHEQHEVRDGDVVHGEYSLHEPDGTIRIVKYTADHKNGFNAQVIRKGQAVHPQNTHQSDFVHFQGHGGQGGY